MKLAAMALVGLMIMCSISIAQKDKLVSFLWAPDVRKAALTKPGGKECDDSNWPITEECQVLERSVGILMMRESKASEGKGTK